MRLAWIGLALLVVSYVGARVRAVPPDVRPATAPASEFSAERALETLRWIEGDGRPHPLGSAEIARVRDGLVERFAALGLEVEVQDTIATDRRRGGKHSGTVARVRNVVATLAGRERTPAVLVCAHYDSVAAGPGTSDDGAGAAALLEIARALKSGAPPRHDVIFLANEGEEAGLLGAEGFVASHPRARDVAVVVNLEARGTEGRAHLFETSVGNEALIATVAPVLEAPSMTSLAYEFYRAMPNDTDLSVFKREGFAGINFAYIGGVARYHTPRDDVAHLDPRSLQHLGTNALACVRALDAADLPLARDPPTALGSGDASYFDVYGWFVVRAPAPVGFVLALGAALWMLVRARRERAANLWRGGAAALAGIVAAALVAHGIAWCVVALQGVRAPWYATPLPLRVAVLLGALTAGIFAARAIAPRQAPLATWRAAQLLVALAGVATAIFVPGAAHVWFVPALVAACVAPGARAPHASTSRGVSTNTQDTPHASESARDANREAAVEPAGLGALALLAPLAAAAFSFGPALVGLEEGFGFHAGVALGAPVGVIAVLAAPSFVRARAHDPRAGRRTLLGLALASLVAATVAVFVRPYDVDSPRSMRFTHVHDAPAQSARWFVATAGEPLDPQVARAGPFGARARVIEWWPRLGEHPAAPAEPSREAPPRLDVVWSALANPAARETDIARAREADAAPTRNADTAQAREASTRRTVRARLLSPRGGRALVVRLPGTARLTAVRQGALERREGFAPNGVVSFLGFGADGIELEIEIASEAPIEVDVVDVSSTPGPGFERLDAARGRAAVPYGEGDTSLIVERVRL